MYIINKERTPCILSRPGGH